jgi:hypothetical protein
MVRTIPDRALFDGAVDNTGVVEAPGDFVLRGHDLSSCQNAALQFMHLVRF